MEYLINLTYDPFICSISVSLILTIGLAYIWNRFMINSYSYFSEKQTEISLCSEFQLDWTKKEAQNPLVTWIIKYVRRKESSKEDSDHLLSVMQS